MLKITLLFLLALTTQSLTAQNNQTAKPLTGSSFYAELGGPGILFSMNYDKRLKKDATGGWGGRAGIGFVGVDDTRFISNPGGGSNFTYTRKSIVTVPLQVNYLFTKPDSKHAFEVGGGVTFLGKKIDVFDNMNTPSSTYITTTFAYRKVPIDGGFSWRIGFTPIITDGYVQESAAISIGYNF
jgi:hypothetical protein